PARRGQGVPGPPAEADRRQRPARVQPALPRPGRRQGGREGARLPPVDQEGGAEAQPVPEEAGRAGEEAPVTGGRFDPGSARGPAAALLGRERKKRNKRGGAKPRRTPHQTTRGTRLELAG